MNLAHFVGEHSYGSIWEALMHYASNWTPFIVVGIMIFVAAKAIKTPTFQEIIVKIRRK